MDTAIHPRATDRRSAPPIAARVRRVVGGFHLSMGGVHLGIVAADPQLYRHFADEASSARRHLS
jgi:hypothetical protein